VERAAREGDDGIGRRHHEVLPVPPPDVPLTGASLSAATPAPAGSAAGAYPPEKHAWYPFGVLALATTFAMLNQGILSLLTQQIIVDFQLTGTPASLLLGPAFASVMCRSASHPHR
jgi:hypothetical protein